MIRIDRRRLDEHGQPIRPSDDWMRKAKEKTNVLRETGKPASFDQAFYRSTEVVRALEKLFYEKCAYCEKKLDETGFDVEHFRPKGRVHEDPKHPGYYWLAYEWENLYPACKFCNQNLQDKPLWDDERTLPAAGKCDQFPVAEPDTRLAGPDDDPAQETRLLLDPCNDDPEHHLSYNPLSFAEPRTRSVRADTSIRVYHLNRRRLRRRRARKLVELRNILSSAPDLVGLLIADDAELAGFCRFVLTDPVAFAL